MSSMGWSATKFTPRVVWWSAAKGTRSAATCIWRRAITIPTTAQLYTDIGLLTCRPEFGEDATNFFNLLTGICQFQPMRKLLVAPFELHERLLKMIAREAENARRGLPARIIPKMNSLADRQVIEALYQASRGRGGNRFD